MSTRLFVFAALLSSVLSNIVISRDLEENDVVSPDNDNGKCSCLNYKCGCCQSVVIDKKELKLNDTVCLNIKYLVQDHGLEFTFLINDKVYINETISAKNPPPICVHIPYLKVMTNICVRFNNLTMNNHSLLGCADLIIKVMYIKVEKVNLGCFRIPSDKSSKVTSPSNDNKDYTMTNEEKLKFLQRLGLLSKSYGDGRLNNYFVGYQ